MDPLAAAFRQRVLAGIRADLAREHTEAEALRAAVTPIVARLLAEARARGDCGRAWLFGSFAWGRPAARSDIDLLVEDCPDPFALSAVVWREVGRPVHVIEARSAPPGLVERVEREGTPL